MSSRTKAGGGIPAQAASELEARLAARAVEVEWLRTHYQRHLRIAYARLEQAEDARRAAASQPAMGADLKLLQAEVERLREAERRYLDRIEELKEAFASRAQPA